MNSILIILLGCNIYNILSNRLESTFKFIEENYKNNTTNYPILIPTQTNNSAYFDHMYSNTLNNQNDYEITKITWFLSGGIKNPFPGAKSEAFQMKSHIDNHINMKYSNGILGTPDGLISHKDKIVWDFVLDEQSTNTAENFIWASHYLNSTSESFESVYVVTSDFHYNRASLMLNLIDSSRKYDWILGDLEQDDLRYWESVHIRNVDLDVSKAKSNIKKFNYNQ